MERHRNEKVISIEEYERLTSLDPGSPYPVFFRLVKDPILDSDELNGKLAGVGIWFYPDRIEYEIARNDHNFIDIERYPIMPENERAVIGKPKKDFPEHHSEEMPYWYSQEAIEL